MNAAEVDPHVRVLVPEQGPELHVILPMKRAPLIASHPRRPGGGVDGVGGRAERQDVEDHPLVVADPIGGGGAALPGPPPADGGGAGARPTSAPPGGD